MLSCIAVWLAGLLLTDLGQFLEELGDGGRVLLDPGHLAPLLDQNLRLFRHEMYIQITKEVVPVSQIQCCIYVTFL